MVHARPIAIATNKSAGTAPSVIQKIIGGVLNVMLGTQHSAEFSSDCHRFPFCFVNLLTQPFGATKLKQLRALAKGQL